MPEGLSLQEQKERNFQYFIKDYLRCVASIDDNVGRLLDYLDAEGLSENTIVSYTSDNGMFQGEQRMGRQEDDVRRELAGAVHGSVSGPNRGRFALL